MGSSQQHCMFLQMLDFESRKKMPNIMFYTVMSIQFEYSAELKLTQ